MAQSLVQKLRIKSGYRMILLNAPKGFAAELGDLPADVKRAKNLTGKFDFILFFARNSGDIKKYGVKIAGAVKDDGVLWTAYPKGGSGIKTDINRDRGWEVLERTGLRRVTSIAMDDVWSALRWRPAVNVKKPTHYVTREQEAQWVDREKKRVKLPPDFAGALGTKASGRAARINYEKLSYSHKREYVLWIIQAKKPETRANRIRKAVTMLSKKSQAFNS